MARQGLAEDLMEVASRLPARAALALAVIFYVVLHLVSVETVPLALVDHGVTIPAAARRGLIYAFASLLQYIVPVCLAFAALAGVLRRRLADRLVATARANPAGALSTMSWRDFERLVGGAFRQRGYDVNDAGGASSDGGIDLSLTKDGRRYLVQCKHWKSSQVGVSIVREMTGVVAAERAAGGIVVTGGQFTADAREFARRAGIELIDGAALEELIGREAASASTAATETSVQSTPACPRCGTVMVRRVAKQGKHLGRAFWGCGQYPKCSGIVQIS